MLPAIEIPKPLRSLERDRRGYPIPFIVMRDRTGRPHFQVNDARQVLRAIRGHLCALCGRRMREGFWFVGGPRCFMHPRGAFVDPPAHEDCARYAMQVCPYLAAPSYARRLDGDRKSVV